MAPLAVFCSWLSYLIRANRHQATNATILPLLCSFPKDGVWVNRHSHTLCISNRILLLSSVTAATFHGNFDFQDEKKWLQVAAEGTFGTDITKSMVQHWNRHSRRIVELPPKKCPKSIFMWHLGIWFTGEHLDLMISEVFSNLNNSVIFYDDKMKSDLHEMVSRLTEYEDCCLMRKEWLAGFSQVSLWDYSDLLSKNIERKKENIHDSFLYWEIPCMVEFLFTNVMTDISKN